MPNLLKPIITDLGSNILKKNSFKGEKIYITYVAVGTGCDHKTSKTTSLSEEIIRTKVTGGELIGFKQKQFNFEVKLTEPCKDITFDIHEIGFFLKTGELFAIISSPLKKIASKTKKIDLILDLDLKLTGTLANQVTASENPIQLPNSFISGENVIKISTQQEFDLIFNQGSQLNDPSQNHLIFDEMGTSVIKKNTSIFLSPIQKTFEPNNLKTDKEHPHTVDGAMGGSGDEAHNTFNGRPAYLLKNPIKLESNTCIMGLNTNDTIVVKENADCNIVISGTKNAPVTGVQLSGWTFDGRGGINGAGGIFKTSKNGAAFSLDFAEDCELNCQIINHNTSGKGGGIFGTENSKYITAENISNNYASLKGSGVYGCNKSSFRLMNCNLTSIFSNIAIINNSAILTDNIITKLRDKKKQSTIPKATTTKETAQKELYSNKDISNLLAADQHIAGTVQISKIEEIIKDPTEIKVITPFILKQFLNKIEDKIGRKIKL